MLTKEMTLALVGLLTSRGFNRTQAFRNHITAEMLGTKNPLSEMELDSLVSTLRNQVAKIDRALEVALVSDPETLLAVVYERRGYVRR